VEAVSFVPSDAHCKNGFAHEGELFFWSKVHLRI